MPGLTAHGLSGQPEGQTEQINVALTLQLVKEGTNFRLFSSAQPLFFTKHAAISYL